MTREHFKFKLYQFIEKNHIGGVNEANDANLTVKQKSAIKKMIDKKIDDQEKKIRKMIQDELKGDKNEKRIVKITSNVLENFYRTLWQQRSFWYNSVKNTRI